MINYYRKFIKNFLKVAKLIIRLTKKKIIFNFRREYKEVFKELKRRITTALILRIYDPKKELIVKTNALNKVIGGYLK